MKRYGRLCVFPHMAQASRDCRNLMSSQTIDLTIFHDKDERVHACNRDQSERHPMALRRKIMNEQSKDVRSQQPGQHNPNQGTSQQHNPNQGTSQQPGQHNPNQGTFDKQGQQGQHSQQQPPKKDVQNREQEDQNREKTGTR
jgi:hypothetical protein